MRAAQRPWPALRPRVPPAAPGPERRSAGLAIQPVNLASQPYRLLRSCTIATPTSLEARENAVLPASAFSASA